MAVSKRLRFEIFRRDGFQCRYCGTPAAETGEGLTVDHVLAVTLGGTDEAANLVTACRDCNAGKSSASADASLIADVADDAVRWAKAMELAREQAMADHEQMRLWRECFRDYWTSYTYVVPQYKRGSGLPETFPLPHDWHASIDSLAVDGMFVAEMRDAVDVAMARTPDDKFRYFVGIVRNKLIARQQVARGLMAVETPPEMEPRRAKLTCEDAWAIHRYRDLADVCDRVGV